jgi:hypothetical protein
MTQLLHEDLGNYVAKNYNDSPDTNHHFDELQIISLDRIMPNLLTFTSTKKVDGLELMGSFDLPYSTVQKIIDFIQDYDEPFVSNLINQLNEEFTSFSNINILPYDITVTVMAKLGKESGKGAEKFRPFIVESINIEKLSKVIWQMQ